MPTTSEATNDPEAGTRARPERAQRGKVFDFLTQADSPRDAREVAAALDIHVTTARFHLNNLLADGRILSAPIRSSGAGRPRVGYSIAPTPPVDDLLGLLLTRLGATEQVREHVAAEAGRLWAARHGSDHADVDLPDPVIVATDLLGHLGFQVSSSMSAFGTHELLICSCPLRDIAAAHPEVARGVVRGAIEQALATSSPALASQYTVTTTPDPSGGDCEIRLTLSRSRMTSTT